MIFLKILFFFSFLVLQKTFSAPATPYSVEPNVISALLGPPPVTTIDLLNELTKTFEKIQTSFHEAVTIANNVVNDCSPHLTPELDLIVKDPLIQLDNLIKTTLLSVSSFTPVDDLLKMALVVVDDLQGITGLANELLDDLFVRELSGCTSGAAKFRILLTKLPIMVDSGAKGFLNVASANSIITSVTEEQLTGLKAQIKISQKEVEEEKLTLIDKLSPFLGNLWALKMNDDIQNIMIDAGEFAEEIVKQLISQLADATQVEEAFEGVELALRELEGILRQGLLDIKDTAQFVPPVLIPITLEILTGFISQVEVAVIPLMDLIGELGEPHYHGLETRTVLWKGVD